MTIILIQLKLVLRAACCTGGIIVAAAQKLGAVAKGPPSRQMSLKRLLSFNRNRLGGLAPIQQPPIK